MKIAYCFVNISNILGGVKKKSFTDKIISKLTYAVVYFVGFHNSTLCILKRLEKKSMYNFKGVPNYK